MHSVGLGYFIFWLLCSKWKEQRKYFSTQMIEEDLLPFMILAWYFALKRPIGGPTYYQDWYRNVCKLMPCLAALHQKV